jgi:hypothetical protein
VLLTVVGCEGDLPTGPLQLQIMLLKPWESEDDVVSSQWCNIEGEGLGVVSDLHPNFYLLVHMQKEVAVDIVDGEWGSFFCDQLVFLYKSQMNEISHGTQVYHGCHLKVVC